MNSSSSSSSSSSDEEFLPYLEYLSRQRKIRVYRNRADHFAVWDDIEFYNRFRLTKRVVNILFQHIVSDISSKTNRNHAVTAKQKFLLTMRFMATNSFLITAGDFVGIHKSTAGKYIWDVLKAMGKLKDLYLHMPQNEEEILEAKRDFYDIARFPNVIGAIDCTHVKIESPGGNEAEIYRNRKGFFSLNVQAICDAKLKIQNIVARWPGSVHDSRIFLNSLVRQRLENGDFGDSLILADSGYAATNYCVTPIPNPTTHRENLYNESQIRTRNTIERTFGILKRRFPILSLGIRLDLLKVQCICVVAAILHNVAIDLNDPAPGTLPAEVENAIEFVNNVPEDTSVDSSISVNNLNMINLLNYFDNLS